MKETRKKQIVIGSVFFSIALSFTFYIIKNVVNNERFIIDSIMFTSGFSNIVAYFIGFKMASRHLEIEQEHRIGRLVLFMFFLIVTFLSLKGFIFDNYL